MVCFLSCFRKEPRPPLWSILIMILVDWFNAECCRGTELIEGWYWHEDDGEGIGGPYDSEEAACEAAQKGKGW